MASISTPNPATRPSAPRSADALLVLGAFLVVLASYGVFPFVALPTLWQSTWSTGFAQSFLNDSIVSIHAHNFGAPEPAAIAFGLAGAYVTTLFLALGFHAADAYSAMVTLWLGVAFLGAWRLAALLGLQPRTAPLAALAWMGSPLIWAHEGYSMLSLGLALLPAYFWSLLAIASQAPSSAAAAVSSAARHWVVCLVAVFMDGYSFMMFASGSIMLMGGLYLHRPDLRHHIMRLALPIHGIGLGLAYLLYSSYIGKAQYEPASLDFFRGWGVDIAYLLRPSRGTHWLWDTLGLSRRRSDLFLFGDESVWRTTFSLPLILFGLAGAWLARRASRLMIGVLLVALFGTYMALGPSLKIDAAKPQWLQEQAPGQASALMPEEFAPIPTGSAVLSENVPGFSSMRAAYRWIALGNFGFWTLLVLGAAALPAAGRPRRWVPAALLLIIVSNLPHVPYHWERGLTLRQMFFRIDADLVDSLRKHVAPGDRVAFLPWRNGVLINYLAAQLDIRSYNIGGDKNLDHARQNWPDLMRGFHMAEVDPWFSNRVVLLLDSGTADAVVIPYFDTYWSADRWPALPQFQLPAAFLSQLHASVQTLRDSGVVDVFEQPYFAVIRRKALPAEADFPERVNSDVAKGWCAPPHSLCPATLIPGAHATQVGEFLDGSLHSRGAAGYLLYGPYVEMSPGRYSLRLHGRARTEGSAWVDIVSHGGTVQHAVATIIPTPDESAGVLVDATVRLADPGDDLEIRVFVEASDQIRLDRYELLPLPSAIVLPKVADDFAYTQVGQIGAGSIRSDGRPGFLVFGPYAHAEAGAYSFTVRGSAADTHDAWVDVVSNSGTVAHARLPLQGGPSQDPGMLVRGTVHLDEAVDDLEIRVFVGNRDKVTLDGYEFRQVAR